MSNCASCGSQAFCYSAQGESENNIPARSAEWLPPAAGVQVGTVLAVVGATGGCGTSLLTSGLALKAVQAGLSVGILDANIAAPDISAMFGLTNAVSLENELFLPHETADSIKVMSYANFMSDATEPMVWGQSMMAGIAEQFWTTVSWNKLDLLLVDLPAGGGDIVLHLAQILPIDAVLPVTTAEPQTLVRAEQTRNLLDLLRLPVAGLIGNLGATRGDAASLETAVVRMGIPELEIMPELPLLHAAAQAGKLDNYDIGNELDGPWNIVKTIMENSLSCAGKGGDGA